MKIGVLSFQGGIIEHILATKKAAQKLQLECEVVKVKYKKDFEKLDGLIIPGGESTTLWKLIEREDIVSEIKEIKAIFGTCAGAIMMSKNVKGLIEGQKTLELMDIETDRNAYGSQTESFEADAKTKFGKIHAVFIRAPKLKAGKNANVIARLDEEEIGLEEKIDGKFYLAASFHPELTTTVFHEYFLKNTSQT